MIIGELDLDWAEQDPDYLDRVKAFLISAAKDRVGLPEQRAIPGQINGGPDSVTPEHALK